MRTKPKPGAVIDPLHPLSKGLVGCWLFNEGAGSVANDISGHGNHGTLTNMLPNVQGSGWSGTPTGGGMAFDGSNDCVDYGTGASLISSDGSVSFWINITDDDVEAVYSIGGTSASDWLSIVLGRSATSDLTDELISILLSSTTVQNNRIGYCTTVSRNELFDGAWHHIGVTAGSEYKIYLDGVSKALTIGLGANNGFWTDKVGTPTHGRIGELYVGAKYYSLDGTIYEVQVYNRMLSAEEVKQLYHTPFCNVLSVPAWQYYVAGGAATYEAALALSQTQQINTVSNAVTNAGVTLSRADLVASGGPAVANATINTNIVQFSENVVQAVMHSAVILTRMNTLTQNGNAVADGMLTLANYLVVIEGASKNIGATFTLSSSSTVAPSASSVAEGTLATALYLAFVQDVGSITDVLLALSHSLTVSQSRDVLVNAALTLNKGNALTTEGVVDAKAALALAYQLVTAQQTGNVYNMAVALAHAQLLAQSAQGDAGGAVHLTATKTVSLEATALALAALTLTQQNTISTSYNSTVSAQVSLAIQKGVSTSAVLELNANTALSQTFGFLAQAQTVTEGSLQLTQFLGLAVIAEAIANANMSLDCVKELTVTATAIIVSLITPDKRT
ncbi:MAG: LamG-like jellyroll fold domain-containing protein, partial [Methanosarcinales archaeon]